MAWQRTVFSSLILALVTTRSGVVRGDILLSSMGVLSVLISLSLLVVSAHRQQAFICDTDLVSANTILIKRLLCCALGLNALAVSLNALVMTF